MAALMPMSLLGQEGEELPPAPDEETEPTELIVEATADDEILEWPTLPEWDPSDLEKVKSGDLVPGHALLREITEDITLPPAPEPDVPVVPLPPEPDPVDPVDDDPTVVPGRYLEAFFGRRPANFLMDPQKILAQQEYRDRESFLEYHAGDSEVNLYVYLFDEEQQLPEGVSLEKVFEEHFARTGPTALVFYFLGHPERSEMMLSEGIRSVVSAEERARALRTSIQEAFEKSDPAHQLDNFAVELSIRLYWFEKAMGTQVAAVDDDLGAPESEAGAPVVAQAPPGSQVLQFLEKSAWGVILLTVLVVVVWIVRLLMRRRFRYLFPEVEVEPLLGAPHAAGVGAVISFSSSQLPPSQQRDHVPDYLQRM